MSTKSKATLYSKFDQLEKTKREVLNMVKDKNNQDLNTSDEGSWSINQVLYHHYLAEKLTIEYINKKLSENGSLENAGITELLKSKLLNLLLWLPIKFKSPKRIADVPETIELNNLINDWSSLRNELKKIINNFSDKAIGSKVFLHPRVGMITMSQTLDFIDMHLKHHIPQIKNQL